MRRIGVVVTLVFIVLLSGCALGEKQLLEKNYIRIADTEELSEVINYIEKYDMLEFVNIDPNNPLVFQGFSIDPGFFVRNISHFLKEVENDYDHQFYYSGELDYFISGKRISSENVSSIKTIAKQIIGDISRYFNPIEAKSFVTYYPLNSSLNETTYLTTYDDFNKVNMTLANSMWLVLVDLTYSWHDRFGGCETYIFEELILLDELSLLPLVLTSTSNHYVC